MHHCRSSRNCLSGSEDSGEFFVSVYLLSLSLCQIIEAGGHSKDLPLHIQPARYYHNLTSSGKTLFQHVGRPSTALDGRAPIIQSGKCVGGGSSVNFAMYTRAAKSDYDDWAALGNIGWGSEDLIPLSNKVFNPAVSHVVCS